MRTQLVDGLFADLLQVVTFFTCVREVRESLGAIDVICSQLLIVRATFRLRLQTSSRRTKSKPQQRKQVQGWDNTFSSPATKFFIAKVIVNGDKFFALYPIFETVIIHSDWFSQTALSLSSNYCCFIKIAANEHRFDVSFIVSMFHSNLRKN